MSHLRRLLAKLPAILILLVLFRLFGVWFLVACFFLAFIVGLAMVVSYEDSLS